jgi:hypothetical protein
LVLSILLVVLVSGAALWVVDGERAKPTSEPPQRPAGDTGVEPTADAVLATVPHGPAPVRQPATSRRVGRLPDIPPEEPHWRDEPVVVPASAPTRPMPRTAAVTALPPVRTLGPPLPRHRLRSAILLVGLVVLIGALVAAVVGVVASGLAVALRAAVTS